MQAKEKWVDVIRGDKRERGINGKMVMNMKGKNKSS